MSKCKTSAAVFAARTTRAKDERDAKRRRPPPPPHQHHAVHASSSSVHRPVKRARTKRQRPSDSMSFATPSLEDIAATVAKHPPVFHNTFFHLQDTTAVGQASQRHVPSHLFPLFAVLAGTAFPPEAVDEALVKPGQLVVGVINSLAPHPGLARAVPSLLALLAEGGHDTAGNECSGSATLTALAAAVSWGNVLRHVSWDQVPVCLLALATQEQDCNRCLRLKWCLQASSVSAPALKQVLQASLESGTYGSVTGIASPFSKQFGRLVSSGEYHQSELVRLVECLSRRGDTGGISHNLEVGRTGLHVACEKGYGDVALCMFRHADAQLACGMVSLDGGTPLVLACKAGLAKVAMAMLDLGVVVCNIQAVDGGSRNAVHWACCKGLKNVAARLLRCESARDMLSAINSDGETPLLLACQSGLDDVAMAMLELDEAACTVKAVNTDKRTALHWACAKRLTNVALRLLRCKGARDVLSVVDSDGDTPLLVACWSRLGDVAMAMLELDEAACIHVIEAVTRTNAQHYIVRVARG